MAVLKLEQRMCDRVTVVSPRGYIDAHTVKDFESCLLKLLEDGSSRILINGKELSYIASAGLGALMGVIEDVRAKEGGDIRLSDLSESVFNVFDILGFTHLFQIFPSEEEALKSFQSEA